MTEIASSSEIDPAPFVLFGTLLFALAAAAGQVLRGDPSLIRRLVQGYDGVGGESGGSAEPSFASDGSGNAQPWPDSQPTLTGDEHLTRADGLFSDAPTSVTASPDAVSFGGQPTGGLGGSSGGLNGLGNGTPGGFEANGFGGGDGLSHDVAGDALGHAGEVQPDQLGDVQSTTRPTDYGLRPPSPADGTPQPAPGGDLGGGPGSDALARGVAPSGSGSELASANGSGGSLGGGQGGLGGGQGGDVLARGAGAPGDLMAHGSASVSSPVDSGLGGVHSTGDGGGSLARNLTTPELELAKLPTGTPGEGMQGGLGGHTGLNDGLARGLAPADGLTIADAGQTVVAPDGGVGGVGPAWLAAGALARAGAFDLSDDEEQPADPPTRSFKCPGCQRSLPFGPRFCGYCGEPLDKTMA